MVPDYEPADFFVLRSPALHAGILDRWGRAPTGGAGSAEPATETDLRSSLRELVRRPDVGGALALASPGLFGRMAGWLAGSASEDALAIEPAVVRYVRRMAGRSTPFGLFAGQQLGRVSQTTRLTVGEGGTSRLHVRLQSAVVDALARHLMQDASVQAQVTLLPNDTLTRAHDGWQYIEGRRIGGTVRLRLVSIEPNPALDRVLSLSRANRGMTVDALVDGLRASDGQVDRAEARAFVSQLIDRQILTGPLRCVATGPESERHLIETVRAIPAASGWSGVLDDAVGELTAAAREGSSAIARRRSRAVEVLRSAGVEVDEAQAVHVDLYKTGMPTLSRGIAADVARATDILLRLRRPRSSPLAAFGSAFAARFQDRTVPLMEALDEETGVPFASAHRAAAEDVPLLAGLDIERRRSEARAWTARDDAMLPLLHEALRSGSREIVLKGADLDKLAGADAVPNPGPIGLSAICAIAAASQTALDAGDHRLHIRTLFGRSSGALLGRFCHGDRSLADAVRRLLAVEDARDPEALHAEIAYLPHARAGTAASRPALRDHDIVLLGASGLPLERQLALDDLALCARQGRITLVQTSTGRRVQPHLSCALEVRDRGPAVYRFLVALAEGDAVDLSFSWGCLAASPFLPAVRVGRTILALARWRLSGADLAPIRGGRDRAARRRAMAELKVRLGLPRHVCLSHGDRALPFDLADVLCVDSLLDATRRSDTVVLGEMFPAAGESAAHGTEGRYQHEIVVPLVRRMRAGADRDPGPSPRPVSSGAPAIRPGGPWLFAKIYGRAASLDGFVGDVVPRLVARSRAAGAVDRWFFVRYADPRPHVRLRLRGDPARLWSEVAPLVLAAVPDARCDHTTIDTYVPEQDRYGGPDGLQQCEILFEADSDAACALVGASQNDPDLRWRLMLLGLDRLLDDFGLDRAARRGLLRRCRDRVLARFDAQVLRPQLSARGRRLRPIVNGLFDDPAAAPASLSAHLDARSRAAAAPIATLQRLERRRDLGRPLPAIVESLLHMWVNRMSRHAPNGHELALYDLLAREYGRPVADAEAGG